MSIRIGINPLSWTNDDMPELGGETPLETCLSEGKEAGYAGFELGHKFPEDPDELGRVLGKHGLALVSGWYSGEVLTREPQEEIKALEPHLRKLKSNGAEVVVFAEVTGCIHGDIERPQSQRPQMTDAEWKTFTSRLNEVAAYARAQGVRVAFHHHMGTVVESEADVDRLMAETSDDVGLLLDTGHMVFAGGDPLAVAQRHRDRICHVHCKDIRRPILEEMRNKDASFLESVLAGAFTVPGDGAIDYVPIFRVLKEAGYQGWLVVEAEQDPAVAHPLTYATKGCQYLRKAASEAGLVVD